MTGSNAGRRSPPFRQLAAGGHPTPSKDGSASAPLSLPAAPERTAVTDITEVPENNAAFLAAIFTGLQEPHRPFVLGFHGNPNDQKDWRGATWRNDSGTESRQQNWYFTLAVYRPREDGYHRQEKDCAAVYGVMLDDLGTKAPQLARLEACPPSYVIETSEGNYQAGYLFPAPVTDLAQVKALNASMVGAGLCDPGAKSPATRYGRLPAAGNGKTEPAFPCRLIEWHPDRRYTIDELVERLELCPLPKPRKPNGKSKVVHDAEDGVYFPRPSENEVLTALRNRGLYKQPLGSGKHDITCPWVTEHTDQLDHGAAYFEPSDLSPVGGFCCQHSHGDTRKIGALLDFLGVTFHSAKHRPTIRVGPGELNRIVDAAERELAGTGRYYQRGGLIVAVYTDPATRETIIKPVSKSALLRASSGVATWMRHDARAGDYVVTDPPDRHMGVLFDSERYDHLRPLAGIARQPHLRPDGSLVREAGFDAETGLFGVFEPRLFEIPESPTKEEAFLAMSEIKGLLPEFEFANPHDFAGALAGMLTAAIRPSLRTSPMFHIRAPQIACGKSYLSAIIATFASPNAPSVIAFPSSEEECQKLLLATLMEGPGAITFDNLTSDLMPFKSLCSALTEEFVTGRILGVSKTATVGTRTLFLSTGNNVNPVRDMTRRCITIMLDPKLETPATRQFAGDPLAAVRQSRERFVSLALIIIRAWIVAGSPATACKPLASFSAWSNWVRQPLLWLGEQDPAESVFAQLAQDPDRESLLRLTHAWRQCFGSTPTMVREAIARANSFGGIGANELREALEDVAELRGEINGKKAGRWIARHQGRTVDGMRFQRAPSNMNAERWAVISDESDKSVISVKPVTPGSADESCAAGPELIL